jgi:hypothetical protein
MHVGENRRSTWSLSSWSLADCESQGMPGARVMCGRCLSTAMSRVSRDFSIAWSSMSRRLTFSDFFASFDSCEALNRRLNRSERAYTWRHQQAVSTMHTVALFLSPACVPVLVGRSSMVGPRSQAMNPLMTDGGRKEERRGRRRRASRDVGGVRLDVCVVASSRVGVYACVVPAGLEHAPTRGSTTDFSRSGNAPERD